MEEGPRFPELDRVMRRVWDDRDDLARGGIHLLSSGTDLIHGQWVKCVDVVAENAAEAERILHERYSDLIRVRVLGPSLTEEHRTPWESYRTDACARRVYLRYVTSDYHVSARAEVTENEDTVRITLIETRRVGPHKLPLNFLEHEVRLASPLAARRVIDGTSTTREGSES